MVLGKSGLAWVGVGWRMLAHVGFFVGPLSARHAQICKERGGIGLDWVRWDWMGLDGIGWGLDRDWMQGEAYSYSTI